MERFMDALLDEVADIQNQLKNPLPLNMTQQNEADFRDAQVCHVCDKPLGADRVRDHDHLTGRYRGAAHNVCNLALQPRRGKDGAALQIPVVFHNLRGYDANHIMQILGNYAASLKTSCIAQNMEKYLTFSLGNLKFIDSMQFMNASLETLVKNLSDTNGGEKKFHQLNSHFPPVQANLLRRKGVYPYTYVSSPEKLQETSLPPREAFYNDLRQEHIEEEDYSHAWNVWDTFEMNTLGDYHDIYLKSDVLLLADVFENFRQLCLQTYKLDPAHYLSSPGLSWDSMLRTTGVVLDLIDDADMFLFLEKGIRGGISMISHRHAVANNPYMEEDFDNTKPTSYIAYWDANNLYGWSMSQPLPQKDFHWLEEDLVSSLDVTQIPDDAEQGYILEVDLEYPDNLHDEHNDYPLVPEPTTIRPGFLSQYTRQLGAHIYGDEKHIPSSKKLVPHLGPRRKYVIHYRNLKQCLEHGLQVTRIHRVLTFHQSAWLEPYISLNTEKRKLAANAFEKDFFKLMNNSIFGKSCENMRNRRNIELVTSDDRLAFLSARPSFKRIKIFNNNLVGVEYAKTSIKMTRPIYTGVTTLDVSKTLMYDFHYNTVKRRYGTRAKLLFTDTDSLCYHIETPDLYRDMGELADLFDTSNYPASHPQFNKTNAKVLGKMKDELAAVPGVEFVGLRPKMYSLLAYDGEEKKTAKGVCRSVIRKQLKHIMYREVLQQGTYTHATMLRIRAQAHQLYTEKLRKVALSAYEDKRYVLDDGISTLAHGHYKSKSTFPPG